MESLGRKPVAISGRWFTVAYGILLTIGVIVGFATIARFQGIMSALELARQRWPRAVETLEERYKKTISSSPRATGFDDPLRLKWDRARSEFLSSVTIRRQAKMIGRLESVARELVEQKPVYRIPRASGPSLDEFIAADRSSNDYKMMRWGSFASSYFGCESLRPSIACSLARYMKMIRSSVVVTPIWMIIAMGMILPDPGWSSEPESPNGVIRSIESKVRDCIQKGDG